MNVDEILEEWNQDAPLNPLRIEEGIVNIPKLHSKYLRYWAMARRELAIIEADLKAFIQLKTCWYGVEGLPKEELDALGWEPRPNVIYKVDMQRYLDGDKDVTKKKLRFAQARLKVEELDFILKEINNRNWEYTRIIELRKFEAGLN